ncbi:MAG TPA: hypothetical protein VHE30_02910 [Polyangiaceae bacterium]|nr:hypothetical protein [Polyangiaceae bacterium]
MNCIKMSALAGFGLLLAACGGDDKVASSGASTNNPDGLPSCGTDPASQPDRCVDDKGAIRCKSTAGYEGDELALCEPDPEKGQLVHLGPSDYTDPVEMAKYTLDAGDEKEFCIRVNTTNSELKYFDAYRGRMRPHSHHLIVTMPTAHVENETTPWECSPQVTERWLFGAQTPQIDVAHLSGAELPVESDPDYGLAHDIPPNQTLLIDLHYVNPTEAPILREAWATLDYVDPADVKTKVDLIGWYNPVINIPANGKFTTNRVVCQVPNDASGTPQSVYLGLATGHAHQRMQRVSVWHTDLSGNEQLIYETHSWHEPGEAFFVKGIENPPLPVAGSGWGATSGYVKVVPGETVSFECEYQNDQDHVVTFGETTKNEMCNIFGFYYPTAGGMWNCL